MRVSTPTIVLVFSSSDFHVGGVDFGSLLHASCNFREIFVEHEIMR